MTPMTRDEQIEDLAIEMAVLSTGVVSDYLRHIGRATTTIDRLGAIDPDPDAVTRPMRADGDDLTVLFALREWVTDQDWRRVDRGLIPGRFVMEIDRWIRVRCTSDGDTGAGRHRQGTR